MLKVHSQLCVLRPSPQNAVPGRNRRVLPPSSHGEEFTDVCGKTESRPSDACFLPTAVLTHNPFSSLNSQISRTVQIKDTTFMENVDLAKERSVMKETADRRVCSSEASDRKSARLNSSHLVISYAVFCLKKKKKNKHQKMTT